MYHCSKMPAPKRQLCGQPEGENNKKVKVSEPRGSNIDDDYGGSKFLSIVS